MPDIAVICGADGKTASLFTCAGIKLFQKNPTGWLFAGSLSVSLDAEKGLPAVRREVNRLIGELAGVRAVVGSELSGVPYHMLDAAGFAVFEMKGSPATCLDDVCRQLEDSPKETEEEPACPQAVGGDGRYLLDLITLQKKRPELSSKMVLLPFFEKTAFYELTVLCSHVPPWFERNLPQMKLCQQADRLPDGTYRVRIFHESCEQRR